MITIAERDFFKKDVASIFSQPTELFFQFSQCEKLSVTGNRPNQRLILIFRVIAVSGKEMIA
jgi:hypothetical protein